MGCPGRCWHHHPWTRLRNDCRKSSWFTWCHGLADEVISEVSSDLKDPVTPGPRSGAAPTHTALFCPGPSPAPPSGRLSGPWGRPSLPGAGLAAVRALPSPPPPAFPSPGYGGPGPDLRPEAVLAAALRDEVSAERCGAPHGAGWLCQGRAAPAAPGVPAGRAVPCPCRWMGRAALPSLDEPGCFPWMARPCAPRRSHPRQGQGRSLIKSGPLRPYRPP